MAKCVKLMISVLLVNGIGATLEATTTVKFSAEVSIARIIGLHTLTAENFIEIFEQKKIMFTTISQCRQKVEKFFLKNKKAGHRTEPERKPVLTAYFH